MVYVMHICKNKKCNNGWIDKDLTNAKSTPPSLKYCRECAKKQGIDFDAQTLTSNLTEKELKYRELQKEKSKKAVAARLKKLNERPRQGVIS